jgi:hypothetical protein
VIQVDIILPVFGRFLGRFHGTGESFVYLAVLRHVGG